MLGYLVLNFDLDVSCQYHALVRTAQKIRTAWSTSIKGKTEKQRAPSLKTNKEMPVLSCHCVHIPLPTSVWNFGEVGGVSVSATRLARVCSIFSAERLYG